MSVSSPCCVEGLRSIFRLRFKIALPKSSTQTCDPWLEALWIGCPERAHARVRVYGGCVWGGGLESEACI